MKVAVFGGATPQSTGNAYEDAFRLGKKLAEAGHVVLTGGYIGSMEAASRGAAEAGGHVIGVTCQEVETWRPVKPNAWVLEEWRCQTLNERIQAIINGCDAAVALPGGIGTLVEIAMMWDLMYIQAIPRKPLILVGSGWKETIEQFYAVQAGYIPEAGRNLVVFAKDIDGVVACLKNGSRNK